VAEVLDECRDFPLKLDVERFDYVEPTVFRLSGDNPVDVSVVIHADADRRIRVNVAVGL